MRRRRRKNFVSKLTLVGRAVYCDACAARWQSGYAADCNSVYAGSIPTLASILMRFARVAELVDAADLKSADRKVVQVQVLFRAPNNSVRYKTFLESYTPDDLRFGTIWHSVSLNLGKEAPCHADDSKANWI